MKSVRDLKASAAICEPLETTIQLVCLFDDELNDISEKVMEYGITMQQIDYHINDMGSAWTHLMKFKSSGDVPLERFNKVVAEAINY